MPDVFTKTKRSEVMSRIRARGNRATELKLMKLFRAGRVTGWLATTTAVRKTRFRVSEATACDLCRWMFLASAPWLQVQLYAEIANRVLAAEVRAECRAGSIGDADSA